MTHVSKVLEVGMTSSDEPERLTAISRLTDINDTLLDMIEKLAVIVPVAIDSDKQVGSAEVPKDSLTVLEDKLALCAHLVSIVYGAVDTLDRRLG